jgi:hypothetical protein
LEEDDKSFLHIEKEMELSNESPSEYSEEEELAYLVTVSWRRKKPGQGE